MKYKLEDLKVGMTVKKEELKEIKYIWMLVKYENDSYENGTLIYFEKENPDNDYSYDIREKIQNYILNTKIDEDRHYQEFWGVYINIDKENLPFEEVECYIEQIMSMVDIPKGKYIIAVDTSFGKFTLYDKW